MTLAPDASAPPPWIRFRASPADLLITSAFVFLLIVLSAHHEMWRDEIHAWGLVESSKGLVSLFHNIRYTGHPGLWYLLLWLTTFVTSSPFAVQVASAVIGTALIALIGLASPFSRTERILLLGSYFVIFEYTVVSRNYGIGMLLALIYAQLRATRPDASIAAGTTLGLLANTNAFAFMLSGALALEHAWTRLDSAQPWRDVVKSLGAGTLIYLACVAVSAAAMWPARDISWRTTGHPLESYADVYRLIAAAGANAGAVLSVDAPDLAGTVLGPSTYVLLCLCIPVLAFVYVYLLGGERRLLIIPALTGLGAIAFNHLIYFGFIRHWGINFVALVTTLWIALSHRRLPTLPIVTIFALSAVAGLAVTVRTWTAPFSNAGRAAEWIETHGLADAALVGTPDTLVSNVAQRLRRPIYFLDCSCTDTYAVFSRRRDDFDQKQIPERLARAMGSFGDRPVVFVDAAPLAPEQAIELQALGVEATEMASFEGAMTGEDFWLYRVTGMALGLRK